LHGSTSYDVQTVKVGQRVVENTAIYIFSKWGPSSIFNVWSTILDNVRRAHGLHCRAKFG